MQLVQVIYNVLIQLVNVLVMPVTKVPSVMLLVVAIPLAQVVQHVMLLQVNVLAILDTQVPHVTHATQITTEQVMEPVQVSLMIGKDSKRASLNVCIFSLWVRCNWIKQFTVR